MEILTFNVIKNAYEKRELRINTVTLTMNKTDKVGLFRCVFCGEAIAQYQGDVRKISPGVEPDDKVLVIDKCHNYDCGALYTFQTHNGYKQKQTKVILSLYPVTKSSQYFFCYVCRKPILKYSNLWSGNLQNSLPISFPYHYKCASTTCPAEYEFSEVL